ncbi:MAG: hypothetical protein ABIR80_15715 [Opitutaceae bacterium]
MIGTTPAATTVIANVALPVPAAFEAPNDTLVAPTVVGVPVMTPVAATMLKPAGSGLAEKLVGAPDAVIVKLNGVPTVAVAASELVIVGLTGAAPMVSVNVAVPVPTALLALRVTVETPAAVGVPPIAPVVALTVRPAGRPVAPKLVGSPVAAIWYWNAAPAVPDAVAALVIAGATAAATMVMVKVALPGPTALTA